MSKRDKAIESWHRLQEGMLVVCEHQFSIPMEIVGELLEGWNRELEYFISEEVKNPLEEENTPRDSAVNSEGELCQKSETKRNT